MRKFRNWVMAGLALSLVIGLALSAYAGPDASASGRGSLGKAEVVPGGDVKSVIYQADGSSATLEVTDGAGYTWKLEVPGKALLSRTTLTMTPLAAVSGLNTPGPLAAGVLLEPDGLQFLEPATLTVTVPEGGKKLLLLTGKHDGAGLSFSEAKPAGTGKGSYTAPVYHFSTAVVADPEADSSHSKWVEAARAEYQQAMTAVRALAGGKSLMSRPPLGDLPTPPSVPVGCSESRDEAAKARDTEEIDRFIEELNRPEADVIRRMVGAERSLMLLGEDFPSEDVDVLVRVAEREQLKAKRLMKQYGEDPEKFPALAKAMIQASRNVALLGGDPGDLSEMGRLARQGRDQLLIRLRKEHDYTVVPSLVEMERLATLIGMEDDDFLKKLGKALTFKLYIDNSSDMRGKSFAGTGSQNFTANWEAVLRHYLRTVDEGKRETPWEWEGKGAISFTSGKITDSGKGGSIDATLVPPLAFKALAGLDDLDACVNKTVNISLELENLMINGPFTAAQITGIFEGTWTVPRFGTQNIRRQYSPFMWQALIHSEWFDRIKWRLEDSAGVTFTVPLKNKKEAAVDETLKFHWSGPDGAGDYVDTFHILLTHAPE